MIARLGATLVAVLTIDAEIIEAIVAHARRDHPIEACGVVAGPAGSDQPRRHIAMMNGEASQTFFRFDSLEQLRVWRDMDERDEVPVVIYHSHTETEAYPSRTDISLATEPDAHYLVVSTRSSQIAEIRSFRIKEGSVLEEDIELINATNDSTAVQTYMFGNRGGDVDYECRA